MQIWFERFRIIARLTSSPTADRLLGLVDGNLTQVVVLSGFRHGPELETAQSLEWQALRLGEQTRYLDSPTAVVVRGSRTYFVAEPVEGGNLAQLLASPKGPPPLDALAYLLACAADALLVVREASARAGLPDAAVNHVVRAAEIGMNIEGGVQFLGLARACESRMANAPLYPIEANEPRDVAPELLRDSPSEPIDNRASVFALGTLLLDCIAAAARADKPRDALAAMAQRDLEAALLRIATHARAPAVAKRMPSLRALQGALHAAVGGNKRPEGFMQLLAIVRSIATANQAALDFCIGAEMRNSLRAGTLRGIGAPAVYDDAGEDDELHAISLLPEVKGLAQSAWYEPPED